MGSDWGRMTRLIRLRKRSSTALDLALIAASALLLINFSQPTDMDASTTARIAQYHQDPWCFTQMVQNGNFEQDVGFISERYNQGSGTKTLTEEDGSHAIDIADRHQVSFGKE